MVEPPKHIVIIGGRAFEDVTNITTDRPTMSYAEAKIFADTGQRVYCSRSLPVPETSEEPESEPEPFWKGLPKYKKRKHRREK